MTPRPEVRGRELGGPDPLDRRVGPPRAAPAPVLPWLLRTRSALGLSPSLTPAVVFLPLGVLLGPRALRVLSENTLANLELPVTIALAVLGILVGVAVGRELRRFRRLFAAASLESCITILAVAAATIYFIDRTGMPASGS